MTFSSFVCLLLAALAACGGRQQAREAPPSAPGSSPTAIEPTRASSDEPVPDTPAVVGGTARPVKRVVASVLDHRLDAAARGMGELAPEDSGSAAEFLEGQTLERTLTPLMGRCYGAVAVATGITELDVQIVVYDLPHAVAPVTVAEDRMHGATAVVGEAGTCFRAGVTTEAKVIVRATRGSGMALVEVFSGPEPSPTPEGFRDRPP